jgi:hypothetical protein
MSAFILKPLQKVIIVLRAVTTPLWIIESYNNSIKKKKENRNCFSS